MAKNTGRSSPSSCNKFACLQCKPRTHRAFPNPRANATLTPLHIHHLQPAIQQTCNSPTQPRIVNPRQYLSHLQRLLLTSNTEPVPALSSAGAEWRAGVEFFWRGALTTKKKKFNGSGYLTGKDTCRPTGRNVRWNTMEQAGGGVLRCGR